MKLFVGAVIGVGLLGPAVLAWGSVSQQVVGGDNYRAAWVPCSDHLSCPSICAVAATPVGIHLQWRARPCGLRRSSP
jgi:hypothetical protein